MTLTVTISIPKSILPHPDEVIPESNCPGASPSMPTHGCVIWARDAHFPDSSPITAMCKLSTPSSGGLAVSNFARERGPFGWCAWLTVYLPTVLTQSTVKQPTDVPTWVHSWLGLNSSWICQLRRQAHLYGTSTALIWVAGPLIHFMEI